jgi:hypothetical protein
VQCTSTRADYRGQARILETFCLPELGIFAKQKAPKAATGRLITGHARSGLVEHQPELLGAADPCRREAGGKGRLRSHQWRGIAFEKPQSSVSWIKSMLTGQPSSHDGDAFVILRQPAPKSLRQKVYCGRNRRVLAFRQGRAVSRARVGTAVLEGGSVRSVCEPWLARLCSSFSPPAVAEGTGLRLRAGVQRLRLIAWRRAAWRRSAM